MAGALLDEQIQFDDAGKPRGGGISCATCELLGRLEKCVTSTSTANRPWRQPMPRTPHKQLMLAFFMNVLGSSSRTERFRMK